MENEAILNIFKTFLKQDKMNSDYVNKLISKIASFVNYNSSGAFLKLDSPISRLVPFPRLHFVTSAFAAQSINKDDQFLHNSLCDSLFIKENCFITCKHDPYMNNFGYCLVFRGLVDRNLQFIKQAFSFIKDLHKAEAGKEYYYVENIRPCINVHKTELDTTIYEAIGIKNYSGIYTFWENLLEKYDTYVQDKNEVRKLVNDGVPETEFADCRESLNAIIQDYKTFQSAVKE